MSPAGERTLGEVPQQDLAWAEGLSDAARQADVLVILHPNNLTGQRFRPEILLDWHTRLALRDGWLVIDEAFIDRTPPPVWPPAGGSVLLSA